MDGRNPGTEYSGCSIVIKFNANNQSFSTHIMGIPWGNFPIIDGEGYFTFMNNDFFLSIAYLSIPRVNVSIYQNWNIIGWYYNFSTTAEPLGQNVIGCTMAIMFNAETQSFTTHIVGAPWDNFEIEQGTGVWIFALESSIWHGEG